MSPPSRPSAWSWRWPPSTWDVTGYAAQVAELEDQLAGKTTAVQALEEQLAEADEALIALYEAQSQTQDTTHQETEDGVQEVSV